MRSLRLGNAAGGSQFSSICAALLLTACIGVRGQTPSAADSIQEVLAAQRDTAKEVPFQESLAEGASPGSGTITLSVERRFQKLEGFGAAVAWYQDRVLGSTPEGLYSFLFPELGLDILRFRNRFERTDPKDGDLAQEVEIFTRAQKALGYRPKLLLTSWSPPARLKASGKEKCFGNLDCTLNKENGQFLYGAFADWWFRSIEQYKTLGLYPDYISIQNEPNFIPPSWEGCKFEARESDRYPSYARALSAVHQRLSALEPRPQLLGPEVLGIHSDRVQRYLSSIDDTLLDGVAHHLYEKGGDDVWDWRDPGPDSYADEMQKLARATSKPLFQTEFNTDEDKGIDGGFETAWLIHHTMVTEGAVAFLYWDLIWDGDKGLVSMHGRSPVPRDQYYSVRHFARYTDPGYQRIGAGSDVKQLIASAYAAPDDSRVTAVILNTGLRAMDAKVDPGAFSASKSQVFRTSYRPGHSKRWEELGSLGNDSVVRMPARSIATVVLER